MSESYGTGEQDEMGEFDVEENRDDGATEQGDAGLEGPGDEGGVGELPEEDENWAD